MHKSRRIRITDINPNLICVLCSGYLIDATTIIECLHSFCRSCIVKYLEHNKYCPICDVQVHKTKPLLNIRSDQTLQDIVYKLVPGLFQNEMCRRRDFYSQHPDKKPSSAEENGEVTQFSHIYTADESISLSLEYYNNNVSSDTDNNSSETKSQTHPSRRYLRCPAAVSVQHLQKLIRAKYGLSNEHRVDIMYMNDRLREDFTLMDIAYIYLWRRKVPLHLTYRIFEVAKKIKLEPVEKIPVKKEELENNTKTWREVQLQISENGIMSVTNIEETKPPQTIEAAKIEVKQDVQLAEIKEEKSDESVVSEEKPKLETVDVQEKKEDPKEEVKKELSEQEVKVGEKRKLETDCDESEPSSKIPKISTPVSTPVSIPVATTASTMVTTPILKPAVQLKNVHQLSRNHPLKIHSQTLKNHTTAQKTLNSAPKITQSIPTPTTSAKILNNNNNTIKIPVTSVPVTSVQNNVQTMPKITPKMEVPKTVEIPKTIISEVKTVGHNSLPNNLKYTQASQSDNTMTTNTKYAENSIQHTIQRLSSMPPVPNPQNSIQYSKVGIVPKKSPVKVGAPIGYKTLRDPPKAWNPQISRQNLVKSSSYNLTTAGTSDSKLDPKIPVSKPAKFFKMRNNMPRYLGNPASGVKPMYQVREGDKSPPDVRKNLELKKPEKKDEKMEIETTAASTIYNKIKVDKIEVKRQGNIIKIDPKTLRPITDKEVPSCSDLPEMKINQSTVPILNPLRTQKSQTSPKIDRRSPKTSYLDVNPKSPLERSSPKISTKNCNQTMTKPLNSPTSKKDKLNLNFTPPNPFIPNLTSPNLAPNQFLYPNFPSYDPRVMNNLSYHNLPLGLSMFYPQPRLNYSGLTSQNLPLTPNLMSSLNLDKNLRVGKSFDISSMAQLNPEIKKTPTKRVESPSYNGETSDKEQKNNKLNLKNLKVDKPEPKLETKVEDRTKTPETIVNKTEKEEPKEKEPDKKDAVEKNEDKKVESNKPVENKVSSNDRKDEEKTVDKKDDSTSA